MTGVTLALQVLLLLGVILLAVGFARTEYAEYKRRKIKLRLMELELLLLEKVRNGDINQDEYHLIDYLLESIRRVPESVTVFWCLGNLINLLVTIHALRPPNEESESSKIIEEWCSLFVSLLAVNTTSRMLFTGIGTAIATAIKLRFKSPRENAIAIIEKMFAQNPLPLKNIASIKQSA